MKIEVGDKVELNNGEVCNVDRMAGDDPGHVNAFGYGPFAIKGMRYHQNGRFGKSGLRDSLSVKRILQKASSFTLHDLQVGPGDVVEYDGTLGGEVKRYTIAGWVEDLCYHMGQDFGGAFSMDLSSCWRIISRVCDDTQISQKVESQPVRETVTLFAGPDGRILERIGTIDLEDGEPDFASVKPKPERETVNLYWRKNTGAKLARYSGFDPTHRITFDLIDGEPDPASIKMEKV